MGMLRDIVQAIVNDPVIPLEKRALKSGVAWKPATRVVVGSRPFCDASSSLPCVSVCEPREACDCGCRPLKTALVEELARRHLNIVVGAMKLGCSGSCKNGPVIGFPQKGFMYLRGKIEDIPEIVEETLIHGRILFDRLSLSPDRAFRSDVYFDKETGAIGVLDGRISMVEVAKYFMEFERGLSCGKCIPCRVGLKRMEESLQRIVAGDGTTDDLEQIKVLCETMKDAPYCGFAMASSQPVFSAIKYFEDEFRAVVKEVPAAAPEEKTEKAKKKLSITPPPLTEPVAATAETPASPLIMGSVREEKSEEVAVEISPVEVPAPPEEVKAVLESVEVAEEMEVISVAPAEEVRTEMEPVAALEEVEAVEVAPPERVEGSEGFPLGVEISPVEVPAPSEEVKAVLESVEVAEEMEVIPAVPVEEERTAMESTAALEEVGAVEVAPPERVEVSEGSPLEVEVSLVESQEPPVVVPEQVPAVEEKAVEDKMAALVVADEVVEPPKVSSEAIVSGEEAPASGGKKRASGKGQATKAKTEKAAKSKKKSPAGAKKGKK